MAVDVVEVAEGGGGLLFAEADDAAAIPAIEAEDDCREAASTRGEGGTELRSGMVREVRRGCRAICIRSSPFGRQVVRPG